MGLLACWNECICPPYKFQYAALASGGAPERAFVGFSMPANFALLALLPYTLLERVPV